MIDGIPNRPLYFYQKDIIGLDHTWATLPTILSKVSVHVSMAALEKDAQILQQSLWDGSLRPWIAMDPVRPSNWWHIVAAVKLLKMWFTTAETGSCHFKNLQKMRLSHILLYCILYLFVILP